MVAVKGNVMTDFVSPGQPGSKAVFLPRYDHWINGKFVKPDSGQYFENITPVTGKVFCEVARGNAKDIDLALDAAHAAAPAAFGCRGDSAGVAGRAASGRTHGTGHPDDLGPDHGRPGGQKPAPGRPVSRREAV